MTLPITPQPNCPMEPPTATETTSTQLFGVLYITLIGMVDSMVPNSGPWSLLGQYHPSYGGHYPLAQQYPILSHLMPLSMPGFLTQGLVATGENLVKSLTSDGLVFSSPNSEHAALSEEDTPVGPPPLEVESPSPKAKLFPHNPPQAHSLAA
ncbi:hypothetical protein DSO57_1021158 [Entomophthora muscae]|uniref:Uncharacterized protein n=1 Tax=Entomophthora muscae TaxID=34485 RepID=A0ACC2TR56_9FUNG|nr:hypothetical protein DSO57_1021158 [Entomophthora muscae]